MKPVTRIFSVIFLVLAGLTIILSLIFLITVPELQQDGEKGKIRRIFRTKNLISGQGVSILKIYGPMDITGQSTFFGTIGGSDQIVKRLEQIRKNPNICAVILRINSPGGTIGSVQEIYAKLLELKEADIKIITSMGDIAASGGYYLAAASDLIFANPGTLTGSIGVIMGNINITGLMEKLGITQEVIKSGEHKDIMSSSRPMTPEERRLMQAMVDDAYSQFVQVVSKHRKLSLERLKTLADGRVFTGAQAKKLGLIDELGTLEDAVKAAGKMAGLGENPLIIPEWTPGMAGPIRVSFSSHLRDLFQIKPQWSRSCPLYMYPDLN